MDDVIAFYQQHLDRTLLRENLRRTPEQRVVQVQRWQETVAALRGGIPHGSGLAPIFRALVDGRVEFVVCGETAAAALGVDECLMRLDVSCRATDVDDVFRALAPFSPRRRTNQSPPIKLQTDLGALDLCIQPDADYADMRASSFVLRAFGVELRCLNREQLVAQLQASGLPRDRALVAELTSR